jgi:hypothetical protein
MRSEILKDVAEKIAVALLESPDVDASSVLVETLKRMDPLAVENDLRILRDWETISQELATCRSLESSETL